jgi:hypothetical protein
MAYRSHKVLLSPRSWTFVVLWAKAFCCVVYAFFSEAAHL